MYCSITGVMNCAREMVVFSALFGSSTAAIVCTTEPGFPGFFQETQMFVLAQLPKRPRPRRARPNDTVIRRLREGEKVYDIEIGEFSAYDGKRGAGHLLQTW
jgi:hypothetical protein